jgi:hypothetical protein
VITTALATPKTRRRWLQFSLRTLLVLGAGRRLGKRYSMVFLATVILVSPAFASETTTGRAYRALAWQETRRGPVTRLWVIPAAKKEAAKKWQTGMIPGTLLEGMDVVHLSGGPWMFIDLSYSGLTNYPELRSLDMSFTEVKDADLVHLAKCPRLEAVGLDFTGVTGTGLQQLKTVRQLRYLSLVGAAVTDKDVAALQQSLPKLKIERRQLRRLDDAPADN